MKKISTIIIDDEPLAIQRVVNLVNDLKNVEVVDTCSTGKKGITQINALEPDLIFLDIQLKDMTGFDILNQLTLKKTPIIIFISAYDEFALKAFDFFAFDYLLKPYKDERFYQSVNKALEYIEPTNLYDYEGKLSDFLAFVQNSTKAKETELLHSKRLPIKLANKVVFLNTSDIKYILASGYYAEIYSGVKKHLLRESLANLIKKLDSSEFIRIHRSTIINVNFILELVHSNYGEIDVKTQDGKLFRISKSYKKDFQKIMGI